MITFRSLSHDDRRLLAASRFGHLPARRIPADWRRILSDEPAYPDDGYDGDMLPDNTEAGDPAAMSSV